MERELLFEMLVPTVYNINDNTTGHYKQMMGNYQWIDKMAHNAVAIAKGERLRTPMDSAYVFPAKEMNVEKATLILVHYKNVNRRFDLMNYERVFKPVIDVLTANGYWVDDNFSVIEGSIFAGGNAKTYKEGNRWLPSHEETLEEKCNLLGMEYRRQNTKQKKISDYDLYQIYKIGE